MTARALFGAAAIAMSACGRTSTAPTAAPSAAVPATVVSLDAPLPVAPVDDSKQPVRLSLSVANVVRHGDTGALSYTFELADDAAFAHVLETLIVPEGTGTTSATLPVALDHATRYYWHARAIDSRSSVWSAVSAVRSFTTTVADDGVYSYVLEIMPASTCTGTVNGRPIEYVTGKLTVVDASMVFNPTISSKNGDPTLVLSLVRDAQMVSGTIEGGAVSQDDYRIATSSVRYLSRSWTLGSVPASARGTVTSAMQFDGTYTGYFESFSAWSDGGNCTGTHGWRLIAQ